MSQLSQLSAVARLSQLSQLSASYGSEADDQGTTAGDYSLLTIYPNEDYSR